MAVLLRNDLNNGKALELKLEDMKNGSYHVTLQGMTVNLRTGCATGTCGDGPDEDYMMYENNMQQFEIFKSYYKALEFYIAMKKEWID